MRKPQDDSMYTVATQIYATARTQNSAVWSELTDEMQCQFLRCIYDAYHAGFDTAITNHWTPPSADTSQEVAGHSSGKGAAEPPVGVKDDDVAWHREKVFESVKSVRRQRHEQYQGKLNQAIVGNFDALGAVWGGLLSAWLCRPIAPIPGWLAANMLAALKLMRIVWNPALDDSYVDAINYCAIAEECYVGREWHTSGSDGDNA